ncbi:hypothetical protein BS78_02G117400 [Paspalum vaginatum]|nr:hypothetical protein BS78_02G117400 [Paspalum vaginatum]
MRRVNLCFISQTNYCRRLRQHRTRNEMNSQQLLVARIGWTNRQKAPKNLDQRMCATQTVGVPIEFPFLHPIIQKSVHLLVGSPVDFLVSFKPNCVHGVYV